MQHRASLALALGFALLLGWGCHRDSEEATPAASVYAQRPDSSEADSIDLSLTIRETAINELLRAIGTLERSGNVLFNLPFMSYELTIAPPQVEFLQDSALLRANVHVNVGGSEYDSPAVGSAHVVYDSIEQTLFLEVGKLVIDVQIKPLGMRIELDQQDISAFYAPRIKLLDGLPMIKDFKVKKSKDEELQVKFAVKQHWISYRPGACVLDMNLEFQNLGEQQPDSTNQSATRQDAE